MCVCVGLGARGGGGSRPHRARFGAGYCSSFLVATRRHVDVARHAFARRRRFLARIGSAGLPAYSITAQPFASRARRAGPARQESIVRLLPPSSPGPRAAKLAKEFQFEPRLNPRFSPFVAFFQLERERAHEERSKLRSATTKLRSVSKDLSNDTSNVSQFERGTQYADLPLGTKPTPTLALSHHHHHHNMQGPRTIITSPKQAEGR